MTDPIEYVWCITHSDVAESTIQKCWYASGSEALDRCELTLADVTVKEPAKYEGPGLW